MGETFPSPPGSSLEAGPYTDVDMLASALRRVILAVCGDESWEGSVADGLALVQQRFTEINAAFAATETLLRQYLTNHCANADAEGLGSRCECKLCHEARALLKLP